MTMRPGSRDRGRDVLRSLVLMALGLAGAAGVCGCYSDDCADGYLCEIPPPEPSPCDGDPATAPALDMCGVFVGEHGDDRNPGTMAEPVNTLQRAIRLAAGSQRGDGKGLPRRVYACGGAFKETITLPSGVDIWGARLCAGSDWSYVGPNQLTTIAPPAGIPLRVTQGEGTSTIFGVRVVAADASADDGKSSIAMILSQGARANVVSSEVIAGDGKDGEPGEDASSERAPDGVLGNDGADACTTEAAAGARPAVTVCDDGAQALGGYGGDGGIERGGDGASGLPEPAGNPPERGLGGLGAVSMNCKDGENGAKGADAGRAAGAVGDGLLSVDGWVGVRGVDGKRGGVGQGGGGGGGGKGRDPARDACPVGRPQGGAAGGSGGSGGCGGRGGKGGDYGGASIAIVALQGSNLTVDASTVLGAKGGNGGVGGTGQWGGFGIDGGRGGRGSVVADWARGCRGGFGGDGGRGGDAGGGLGGHSLGIGSVGASVTISESATVSPGQAGTGGLGGNAAPEGRLGMGNDGTALFWYRFDAPDPEPPR